MQKSPQWEAEVAGFGEAELPDFSFDHNDALLGVLSCILDTFASHLPLLSFRKRKRILSGAAASDSCSACV